MNNSISDNNYFHKFGLEMDPFPSTETNENIYLTPEINRRLKQLKQHISASQKLLLVASASGAGKSLLALKLVVLKGSDWRVSLIAVHADMKIDALAHAVILQLLPDKNTHISQSISMLHKYLEQSYRDETLPVILIDDAETLSFDTLQFVLQLADLRYKDSFFRIVLFANESINETLEKTGLKELSEGVVDIFSMPCFSREQILAYLKFRFSSCGNDIELPFTNNDIQYLHEASAGLPGGINILARQLMQQAIKKKNADGRFSLITTTCLMLLLALSAWLYNENRNLHIAQANLVAENRSGPFEIPDKGKVLKIKTDPESTRELSSRDQGKITNRDDSLSLKLSDMLIIKSDNQLNSP